MALRIVSIAAEPLSVPLVEPFVIATGRVEATPSVLVSVVLECKESGRRAEGLGESATLPGVTHESARDVLFSILDAAPRLHGLELKDDRFYGLTSCLDAAFPAAPVARAGLETALLDSLSRLKDQPLHALLRGEDTMPAPLTTDVTIPIAAPTHQAELAAGWWARGFRHFKIKVGRDLDDDLAGLEAICERTPEAWLRLDANTAYSATEAIALAHSCHEIGVRVECFEQPCGRLAIDAMAEVTAAIDPPVIADESVATLDDLRRVIDRGAARGVNLKLAKSGGPLKALAIGRAARQAGLKLMMGAMVETRLGISAAAHVAAALGGIDFPDLDTAFLLAEDPFEGGYEAEGSRLALTPSFGLGVARR